MQKVKILDADETAINRWLSEHARTHVVEMIPFTASNGNTAVLIRYDDWSSTTEGGSQVPL